MAKDSESENDPNANLENTEGKGNKSSWDFFINDDESTVTPSIDEDLIKINSTDFSNDLKGLGEGSKLEKGFGDLDDPVLRGVLEYGLDNDDVNTENYGNHTLKAMDFFKNNYSHIGLSNKDLFAMVKNLNKDQAMGVMSPYLFDRDVVLNPNFGIHISNAMTEIISKLSPDSEDVTSGNAITKAKEEVLSRVEGLNKIQAEGLLEFDLTKEQVENKFYNEDVLKAIRAISAVNPELKGEDIYEGLLAMKINEIRGVLAGLTLEQVGIVGDEFKKDESGNLNFGGYTVDAIEFLRAQDPDMTLDEAYDIALELDSKQVLGLVKLGLTLQEVSSQKYQDLENIEVLFEGVQDFEDIDDFEFTLSKELKAIVGKAFDDLPEQPLSEEQQNRFSKPMNFKDRLPDKPSAGNQLNSKLDEINKPKTKRNNGIK